MLAKAKTMTPTAVPSHKSAYRVVHVSPLSLMPSKHVYILRIRAEHSVEQNLASKLAKGMGAYCCVLLIG